MAGLEGGDVLWRNDVGVGNVVLCDATALLEFDFAAPGRRPNEPGSVGQDDAFPSTRPRMLPCGAAGRLILMSRFRVVTNRRGLPPGREEFL